jgi:hypothetical protein
MDGTKGNHIVWNIAFGVFLGLMMFTLVGSAVFMVLRMTGDLH